MTADQTSYSTQAIYKMRTRYTSSSKAGRLYKSLYTGTDVKVRTPVDDSTCQLRPVPRIHRSCITGNELLLGCPPSSHQQTIELPSRITNRLTASASSASSAQHARLNAGEKMLKSWYKGSSAPLRAGNKMSPTLSVLWAPLPLVPGTPPRAGLARSALSFSPFSR